MEICAICNQDLGNENVIFFGYSISQEDRYHHQDTITIHADCCPSDLIQRLELKLIFD